MPLPISPLPVNPNLTFLFPIDELHERKIFNPVDSGSIRGCWTMNTINRGLWNSPTHSIQVLSSPSPKSNSKSTIEEASSFFSKSFVSPPNHSIPIPIAPQFNSHQNTRPIRAPLLTTSFWSLEVN